MKKSCVALLFCLGTLFAGFAQTEGVKRIPLNYYLVGEANGIEVRIELTDQLIDWENYLIDPSDIESDITDDGLRKILRLMMNSITVQIRNKTDKTVRLNAIADKLVLSNGDIQNEYNLIDTVDEYPTIIMRKASVKFFVKNIYDPITTSMGGTYARKALLVNLAIYRIDRALQIRLINNEADVDAILTSINKEYEDQGLFGEYLFGLDNIDMQLKLLVEKD